VFKSYVHIKKIPAIIICIWSLLRIIDTKHTIDLKYGHTVFPQPAQVTYTMACPIKQSNAIYTHSIQLINPFSAKNLLIPK